MRILGFLILLLVAVSASVPAADLYPWINAALYENIKSTQSYAYNNYADANFVADHYDWAMAHLQAVNDHVQLRNPQLKVIPFTGQAYWSTYNLQQLQVFLASHPQYNNYASLEGMYLHFQCDTVQNGVNIPGCNLKNAATGECFGTPAAGCAASTATSMPQSRVPDPDPGYQSQGWLLPNYNSPTYEEFSVWMLQTVLEYYLAAPNGGAHKAHGVMWDNILYLGSNHIENTQEYRGIPDVNGVDHPRDADYHAFYVRVRNRINALPSVGGSLLWMGNANHMWWLRSDGPYIAWVLANLPAFTPESWVYPISRDGDYGTPSWDLDCSDLHEIIQYTVDSPHDMFVDTYNFPTSENCNAAPDLRTRAFSLAKYYLSKTDRLYFAYSECALGDSLQTTEWNPMANVNIGLPRQNPSGVRDFLGNTGTDRMFGWLSPTSTLSCNSAGISQLVAARHFQNGLVLARWKSVRCSRAQYQSPGYCDCGPACSDSYADARSYSLANPYNPLGYYYPVQSDGTLASAPVNSITLRTNEAALLINACGDGQVPVGTTCACGGTMLSAGQWCCSSQPKSVCTDSTGCNNGYVCINPNSCQAKCVLPGSTSTPTPSPSPTPSPTPTPTGTATPFPTPTPTPSVTASPTPTNSPSPTASPTSASTPTPTALPTSTLDASTTPTPFPTDSPSITPQPTEVPSIPVGNGGGSGGGYSGPGSSYPNPPSPTAAPFPSVFGLTPTPMLTWNELHAQAQTDLAEVSDSGEDTSEVQLLLAQAHDARDAGNLSQSAKLLALARQKLDAILLKVRGQKASAYWPLALLALGVLVVVAVYYASRIRKPPLPPIPGTGENRPPLQVEENPMPSFIAKPEEKPVQPSET